MRLYVALFAMVAAASPAAAQSTYVGASLVADVARYSKIDYEDDAFARFAGDEVSNDGEALGFNVRIGREIGRRWGVEFEFARTGEYENSISTFVPALWRERLDLTVAPFEFETERTHTMLGALAWVRQELGDRVEVSYLGGLSFSRVETEQEYTGPRILIFPPITVPSYTTISYGVGPALGLESAVKFGAAAVTAGVRLQTVSGANGWLIRPNIGIRWTF